VAESGKNGGTKKGALSIFGDVKGGKRLVENRKADFGGWEGRYEGSGLNLKNKTG